MAVTCIGVEDFIFVFLVSNLIVNCYDEKGAAFGTSVFGFSAVPGAAPVGSSLLGIFGPLFLGARAIAPGLWPVAEAPTHFLAHFFALLRCQRLPMFHHSATAPRAEPSTPAGKTTKQNSRQHQDTQRLPVTDRLDGEHFRENAVPQPVNCQG